jgi:aspartyl-tRNA(Asn)/glutamyl-tRNA(Gln) amidotransferase subunit A
LGRSAIDTDQDSIFVTQVPVSGAGPRLAVKDLFDTAGLITTYGSAIFRGHVPDRTAVAVSQLEQAGYRLVGKANLHEFAYGVTSQNPHFGTVPNPRYPGRTAGGSSGGSAAAVAADLAELGLGTDSAGSIRIPAACCGVVGFKPTYGLVSLVNCFPLAPSFDHAGPITRTVAECTAAMSVLAPDVRVSELESLEELSVGVTWTEHADPFVRSTVTAAAGCLPRRRRIDFPFPTDVDPQFMDEVAAVHRELFAVLHNEYGKNVRSKIERSLSVDSRAVTESQRHRADYRDRAAEAMDGLDLLITPTLPYGPPRADVNELEERGRMIQFTRPFNVLGWPALTIPCSPAGASLPASLQLIGRPGSDALVLAAGQLIAGELASRSG